MSKREFNIDDEIKLLKQKRKKLEEIKSSLNKKKENEIKKTNLHSNYKSTSKNPKNTSKEPSSNKLDHDRLALSKEEILQFCDLVLSKWNNDPSKNIKHILAMNAIKTSVVWTDEQTLQDIWKEIFNWVFELLYKNAIAQANEEHLSWSKVLESLGSK